MRNLLSKPSDKYQFANASNLHALGVSHAAGATSYFIDLTLVYPGELPAGVHLRLTPRMKLETHIHYCWGMAWY